MKLYSKIKLFLITYLLLTAPTYSSLFDKPYLGIEFSEYQHPTINGVLISSILPNSSAANSELKKNDIIFMLDFNFLPTKNKVGFVKDFISNKKQIGDLLYLNILRSSIEISKKINDKFINVDFGFNDVKNTIMDGPYNTSELFNFNKTLVSKKLLLELGPHPNLSQTTPNVYINSFQSSGISIFSPFYDTFFDFLATRNMYEKRLYSLRQEHLIKEFWDDSLRINNTRYLNVNFNKSNSFLKALKHDFISLTPKSSYSKLSKMIDVPIDTYNHLQMPTSFNFSDHINHIEKLLNLGLFHLNLALEELSKDEILKLESYIPQLTDYLKQNFVISNADLPNIPFEILDISKKINFKQLFLGYSYIQQLTSMEWLDNFEESIYLYRNNQYKHPGIAGNIIYYKEFSNGLNIVVGDVQDNVYSNDFSIIVDIGGNDLYRNNAAGFFKGSSINILIDFQGNDTYSSTQDYSQAASFLGYSLLIDTKGNDTYRAKQLSQANAFYGCSLLSDLSGNDSYLSNEFSQGVAFFGVSILYDSIGNDSYYSGHFSQGVGLPSGLGAVLDIEGDDKYQLGNQYLNALKHKGIYKGAGQGFGFGFKHIASGGIGILYDKKGNDSFEAGNFSLGSAYYYGLGIFMNIYGDDTYKTSRYSLGSAAHSSTGLFSDFSGDDYYMPLFGYSLALSTGFSSAYFLDAEGDDTYDCKGDIYLLGASRINSFSFFNDKSGSDTYCNYAINTPPFLNDTDSNSLSIFLDEGGQYDKYHNSFENNQIKKLNSSFIFLDLEESLHNFKTLNSDN